jgi:hypothetical protein
VLERIAFVFYLATVVGAFGLTGLGLIFMLVLDEARPLCAGLAGGALARLLHDHGYRAWHFRRWEDCFEPSDRRLAFELDTVHEARARELDRLLGELAAATESTERRDVWEVQGLRHEVNALLASDPGLRHEFASELERHPDVG